MNTRTIVLIAGTFVLIGVAGRLVPHAPNATPLLALALVSSVYLGRRWAPFVPLGALALSDVWIGLYDWRIMASVYLSFLLIGMLAWVARRHYAAAAAVVVLGPVLFFLVTNFAVWAFSPWYAKDLAGLLLTYELGLPFFRTMLVGDIAYTALLFAACEFVRGTWSTRGIVREWGGRTRLQQQAATLST